jgi:hypothetical protein
VPDATPAHNKMPADAGILLNNALNLEATFAQQCFANANL